MLGIPGPLKSNNDTAVQANGSGIGLTASDAELPSGNSPRTVELWWEGQTGCGATPPLVSYGSDFSIGLVRYSNCSSGGDQVWVSGNGTKVDIPTSANIESNGDQRWYLIDVTFNGSSVSAYVDGQLGGTTALTTNTDLSAAALTLGTTGGNYARIGHLSDCAVTGEY